jgi:hypothetical protein
MTSSVGLKGVLTVLTAIAAGFALPAAGQPPADPWAVSIQTGALNQWDSGVEGGGDLGIDAWAVNAGFTYGAIPDLRLGLSAGYGERRYDFSGEGDFTGLDPWSDVRDLRVSGSLSWQADERWNLFAVPTVRWDAERGASLDDAVVGGLLAAASYRFSDRLSIGPGFGVFSELEDGTDWFPILAIDWRITDTLSLRTGRGFAASRGPGLTLNWEPSERWSFALGGRYEKVRFRLDDSGLAPGGVGQETSIPLYLGATRSFGRHLRVSIFAGADLGGELRLEDKDGHLIDRADYDTAPFGGATLDLRF